MKLTLQIRRLMRDSIRYYIAPFTGAYKGIIAEFAQIDREIELERKAQATPINSKRNSLD